MNQIVTTPKILLHTLVNQNRPAFFFTKDWWTTLWLFFFMIKLSHYTFEAYTSRLVMYHRWMHRIHWDVDLCKKKCPSINRCSFLAVVVTWLCYLCVLSVCHTLQCIRHECLLYSHISNYYCIGKKLTFRES